MGRRLLRTNVKHCLRISEKLFLIFAGKHIFHFSIDTESVFPVSKINGSRPLRVCVTKNAIYYGEYKSNPERGPIHVWGSSDLGRTWQVVHQFENIRHVHGVFKDPFEECFWVTTGDDDHEAAIWRFDGDWKNGKRMLHGSQQTRVIDLLFTKSELFFGSDAPHEENWIYKWTRGEESPIAVQQVDGTVFHAATSGNSIYCTTCVEPSYTNVHRSSQLWSCSDRSNWKLEASLQKDWWSMKYFEYGQTILPAGPGTSKDDLWITPYATRHDQHSLLIDLASSTQT